MTDFSAYPLLTALVFLPLAGSLFILWASNRRRVQFVSLVTALLTFGLTLVPLLAFRLDQGGFQLVERHAWIDAFGITYHLGIDGLSLFLLPLTGLLLVASVLVSWDRIETKLKGYHVSLMVLATGMLGVFVALDAVLFYIFWEAMLIPMFLIIGIWGGENRRYAAIKFIIYTMAGSLFLLIGLLVIAFLGKSLGYGFSFDITRWVLFHVPSDVQTWLFLLFFAAFAVKIPLFPFHTWLPHAHVEAPTAGSVILAGVLLKMGVYGILRFCFPLFPEAVAFYTPYIMVLGIIGIIYGALVALAQDDIKKLVAYSSVSHMGFIVVGIFSLNLAGLKGGILQMLNHGLSTGALFILVGAIYERKKTRDLNRLGGLAGRVPVLATFFVMTVLSSLGLPGLNGFAGEFLLLLGAFQYQWQLGALAALTVVLGAVYMLWMTQRVLFEQDRSADGKTVPDFSLREWLTLVPMVLLFFIGLYPSAMTDRMDRVSRDIISMAAPKGSNPVLATREIQEITREGSLHDDASGH